MPNILLEIKKMPNFATLKVRRRVPHDLSDSYAIA